METVTCTTWATAPDDLVRRCRHDPVFFGRKVLGGETAWQRQIQILRALQTHPRVAVRSGHGVGKTWTAARAALWFLFSYPHSIVLTTAPTQRQVKSILWAEIRRQARAARLALGGELTGTRLTLADDWFALGLATDDPARFQGYHAEHLLLIFDEAPGVTEEIYEAARGVLTSHHARVLLIGNPTVPSGPFYEAFRSPEWHTLHIPCTACPNVTKRRAIYPKLVTAPWVETQAREWGRESMAYRARVLGEFPEESDARLTPLAWVHAAQERARRLPPSAELCMGVDVARYGVDRTVLLVADRHAVREVLTASGLSTMETAGRVIATARRHGIPPARIAIDDTGVGGGVTDRLREQGMAVAAVQAAGAARSANFVNRRAELFWAVREALGPDAEHPLALPARFDQLAQELTAIAYGFTSAGRIQVEGKEAIRARLGRSPDQADALALAFAAAPTVSDEPRVWVL